MVEETQDVLLETVDSIPILIGARFLEFDFEANQAGSFMNLMGVA